uniref:Zinc finger, CCHC-type n=1 Tax=Tanacetum cinerariifolium TaxID=118510 RepID=A0A699HTZ6_TANCI|nr:zinc finger, CCHC-type [Tanacetum cinerariifolium]
MGEDAIISQRDRLAVVGSIQQVVSEPCLGLGWQLGYLEVSGLKLQRRRGFASILGSQRSRFQEYRLKRVYAISVFGAACLVVRSTRDFFLEGFDYRGFTTSCRNDDVTSKVVLYRNIGFNDSGEYKKTFIGFGVGTGSMQVLQGVEFEVKPHEDHTFEVEPHGNVDHVVGSQKVQTQDLIYYYLARDREQHSAWELFSYREDRNKDAFVVAVVDKINAHESLTFNKIIASEVISNDDNDGYYLEYTPGLLDRVKANVLGMEIVRDQSGNTLRVSQSRFYNGKLVQTLLEEHSILSLKGSLSGDCDVEKNGKWSCIYAVGSQEYQMVCTRLNIESKDVGMLDKFDHGSQTDVDDTRMCGKLRSYDAAHDGFVNN